MFPIAYFSLHVLSKRTYFKQNSCWKLDGAYVSEKNHFHSWTWIQVQYWKPWALWSKTMLANNLRKGMFVSLKQVLVQKCWFYFWPFQAVLCTWKTLAFVQKENLLPRRVKCLKWVLFLIVNSFIGPNNFLLLIKHYTYILDSTISVSKITVLCQKYS